MKILVTGAAGFIGFHLSEFLLKKKYKCSYILCNADYNYKTNLYSTEKIHIKSDFGKYNTKNFDTIFSKNVIITYLDHEITGEYLDFSMEKNLMVISRNIIYTSLENILKADVITMDIKTKDIKIQMYEDKKKVNIKTFKNKIN